MRRPQIDRGVVAARNKVLPIGGQGQLSFGPGVAAVGQRFVTGGGGHGRQAEGVQGTGLVGGADDKLVDEIRRGRVGKAVVVLIANFIEVVGVAGIDALDRNGHGRDGNGNGIGAGLGIGMRADHTECLGAGVVGDGARASGCAVAPVDAGRELGRGVGDAQGGQVRHQPWIGEGGDGLIGEAHPAGGVDGRHAGHDERRIGDPSGGGNRGTILLFGSVMVTLIG